MPPVTVALLHGSQAFFLSQAQYLVQGFQHSELSIIYPGEHDMPLTLHKLLSKYVVLLTKLPQWGHLLLKSLHQECWPLQCKDQPLQQQL